MTNENKISKSRSMLIQTTTLPPPPKKKNLQLLLTTTFKKEILSFLNLSHATKCSILPQFDQVGFINKSILLHE
jgi:hypothetical protein